MSGFYVNSNKYIAAENSAIDALNNSTSINNIIEQIKSIATKYNKYNNIIFDVTDRITSEFNKLDDTLIDIAKIKQELTTIDSSFAFNLVKNKKISTEIKGNVVVDKYNGYTVMTIDNKCLIFLDKMENGLLTQKQIGVLYLDTNIYEDHTAEKKVKYMRYDPITGEYKNISIFDKENSEISQFGADQSSFADFQNLINEKVIWDKLQEVYPVSSFESEEKAMEFYERYFNVIYKTGCGYAAVANVIFKRYEGREEEFEKKFGFPMYSVNNGQINFNYEYIMLDHFNYEFANKYTIDQMEKGIDVNNNIEDFFRDDAKSTSIDYGNIDDFLKDKYDISIDLNNDFLNKFPNISSDTDYLMKQYYPNYDATNADIRSNVYENDYVIYGGNGYDLKTLDGKVVSEAGGGHAMLIVGETEKGEILVSSWGKEYIMIPKGEKSWALDSYRLYRINF